MTSRRRVSPLTWRRAQEVPGGAKREHLMPRTIRKVRVNAAAAIGALVLAAVLVLLAVPLAQADHGNKNAAGLEHVQQSHTSDCGVASVTLTVPDTTEKSAQ